MIKTFNPHLTLLIRGKINNHQKTVETRQGQSFAITPPTKDFAPDTRRPV